MWSVPSRWSASWFPHPGQDDPRLPAVHAFGDAHIPYLVVMTELSSRRATSAWLRNSLRLPPP